MTYKELGILQGEVTYIQTNYGHVYFTLAASQIMDSLIKYPWDAVKVTRDMARGFDLGDLLYTKDHLECLRARTFGQFLEQRQLGVDL